MRALTLCFVAAALVAVAMAADDKKINCYECAGVENCKAVKDEQAKECASGKCFIYGDSDKEDWNRGCVPDAEKDKYCDNKDRKNCTTCDSDKCNSATSIASSAALSLVVALLMKTFY